MDPMNGMLVLIPYVIEWIKERRQTAADVDAKEFRAWLEDTVVPQLLGQSEQVLNTVLASHHAHHGELRQTLEAQFAQILGAIKGLERSLPRLPTVEGSWASLGGHAQELLRKLREHANETDYDDAQVQTYFGRPQLDDEIRQDAAEMLEARGLARVVETTGAAFVRLSGLGYLVAEAAKDREGLVARLTRIRDALVLYKGAPVDKVVAHTAGRCTSAFVFAVAQRWGAIGWVSLEELDQRECSRIHQVSPLLRDKTPEELMTATLEPFLKE